MYSARIPSADDSFLQISTSALDSWLSRTEQVGVLSDRRLLTRSGIQLSRCSPRRGFNVMPADGNIREEKEKKRRKKNQRQASARCAAPGGRLPEVPRSPKSCIVSCLQPARPPTTSCGRDGSVRQKTNCRPVKCCDPRRVWMTCLRPVSGADCWF